MCACVQAAALSKRLDDAATESQQSLAAAKTAANNAAELAEDRARVVQEQRELIAELQADLVSAHAAGAVLRRHVL